MYNKHSCNIYPDKQICQTMYCNQNLKHLQKGETFHHTFQSNIQIIDIRVIFKSRLDVTSTNVDFCPSYKCNFLKKIVLDNVFPSPVTITDGS